MKHLIKFISSALIIQSIISNTDIHVDTADFKDLVLNNEIFVDKSLLIDQLLRSSKINLILRPNGWGKSTNMDMIRRFFEIEVDESGNQLPAEQTINDKLFLGGVINTGSNQIKTLPPLKVANTCSISHLGKYPVILLKFKNITGGGSYEEIVQNINASMMEAYKAHEYLLNSPRIHESDLAQLEEYFKEGFDVRSLEISLGFLSFTLYQHFNQSVIVLIDDYEIPVINAFTIHPPPNQNQISEDHYRIRQILMYMYKSTFATPYAISGEKPAREIKTGLLVGEHLIPLDDLEQRLSGDSIHELYNKTGFSQFYGITEPEMAELLSKLPNFQTNALQIKTWYNGYKIEQQIIYNTRSTMKYFAQNGTFASYAMEVHSNDPTGYIGREILQSVEMQKKIRSFILDGKQTYTTMHKYLDMPHVSEGCSQGNQIIILINKGYLALDRHHLDPNDIDWRMYVPNKEIKSLFEAVTTQWVQEKFAMNKWEFRNLAISLSTGDVSQFKEDLEEHHRNAVQRLEIGDDNFHRFYKNINNNFLSVLYTGLMFALQLNLSSTHYVIQSEDHWREGWVPQSHVMHIIPKLNLSNMAILIKYKIIEEELREDALKWEAGNSLEQIYIEEYENEWKDFDHAEIQNTIKLSIVINSEQIAVDYKED